MTYDVFYLLNELDLLEMRLEFLNSSVDKFVIVESTCTFSGVAKPLNFSDNITRFEKWHDKIIYYVVSDFENETILEMALKSPNTNYGEEPWLTEFYIKESARLALEGLKDDDIVFISDLDEFWNPKLVYQPVGDEVLKPKQLPYLYYFNQRTDEDWLGWSGTVCCRYETIKNGIINHIRTDELQSYTIVENGGWHFNALGGKEQKQAAAQHPLVSSKADWDRREVNMRVDESDLPEYIISNKLRYDKYFK